MAEAAIAYDITEDAPRRVRGEQEATPVRAAMSPGPCEPVQSRRQGVRDEDVARLSLHQSRTREWCVAGGPDIETPRATRLAQTGLPPPRAPRPAGIQPFPAIAAR